ncbi:MAG TPA: DUF5667 domain-containing protein [Nocardioidaceae bacterium]|nr:DUF5667 domain-containing protein [Nocardioidaceae bacterium]
MTSLFQARRRAEEFAAAVDGGAESRRDGSEEITTLLGLVSTLREQAPVEPRAEFASDLRSRLMLEAETALRPETANLLLPQRERGRRERRLVAAASAFVLVGGTATMAAAAQSSLPGDALYPIKRGIEQAEAGLNMSTAGKGKDLLSQASDRLVEVEGLVGTESARSAPRVPETLADFSGSADEGATLLFDAFRESADPEAIVAVRTFTTEGIATLEALADEVPDDAQDELAAAAMLLQEIDSEATALCGGCAADLPVVEVPDIFLARAEVTKALSRAAGADLDNNHPVVVPKGAVPAAPEAAEPSPADDPTDTTGEAPTPTPLPSPEWEEPEGWPTLLPGLEDGTTTKNDEPSATESLADGLSGVVETLLPDTDLTN